MKNRYDHPDWELLQKRYDAWWNTEIYDEPMVRVRARKHDPLPTPAPDDLIERWTDPEYLLPRSRRDMEATWFGGVDFPTYWPNLGPGIGGAYLGSPVHFDETTNWFGATIERWPSPLPQFDPDGRWWQTTLNMTQAAADDANGEYLIAMTDLGGATDLISSLRGNASLCTDLIEHPQEIVKLREHVVPCWKEWYSTLHEIVKKNQSATTGWLSALGSGRSYPLQCDFAALISPEMFREFAVPELTALADWLDFAIYHLDGPDAIDKLDDLLAIDSIQAIQWVPGSGVEPAEAWIPLLKRIQDAGKSIYAHTGLDGTIRLYEELRPEGLMVSTGCSTPDEGRAFLAEVSKIAAAKANSR